MLTLLGMDKIKQKLTYKLLIFFAHVLKSIGVEIPAVFAVCGIIKKGKKILAIDLSYRKGLALPGGKVEREESLEKALKREIKEETGADVKSLKYFTSFALPKSYLTGLTACFKVELKNTKLTSSEEGKPIWVTPKEFTKRASYKDNKYFVEKYFEKN